MAHITLHTDGGARGNPGPSGAGIVIEKDGVLVEEMAIFLGHQTNNWAEYEALALALQRTSELLGAESPAATVEAFLDSELVVKQLNGQYRVREETLKPQCEKVKIAAQSFKTVKYIHVRREKNKDADRLANEAMDRGK